MLTMANIADTTTRELVMGYTTKVDNSDLYGPVVAFLYRLRFVFLLAAIVLGVCGSITAAIVFEPTPAAPTYTTVTTVTLPECEHEFSPMCHWSGGANGEGDHYDTDAFGERIN